MTRKREPYVTTARAARGRERVLTDRQPLPLVVAASLDVIARLRAAHDPLDKVVAAVGRERHLGPRERHAVADLAFAWARHKAAVEQRIDDAVMHERGLAPRRAVVDLCAVCLAALASGGEVGVDGVDGGALEVAKRGLPDFLQALVDDALVAGLHLPVSLPPWLVRGLTRSFGDDPVRGGAALARALQEHARPVLAVDVRAVSIDAVVKGLADVGVTASPSPLSSTAVRIDAGRLRLGKLPRALRAVVWPMDDGSQAVADAVDVKPGERVLDLCAGGGGKARLMAQKGAYVVAADLDEGRLLRSLPDGVVGVVADGTKAPFRPGSFDRVLVDAPCSGTGTLRRAPDLALRLREDEVPALAKTQQALLSSALSLVKPGGVVVYATCSLLRDENEDVVDAVLSSTKTKAARTQPDRHFVPPTSDGFFVARLTRP